MKKQFDQHCPVARTLDVIGEKWTILILRELFLFGPRRFQDFADRLTGISPNTLSDRLKKLEASGILKRSFYDEHPPRAEYHLTDKGDELGPILLALKKWGEDNTSVG
ncbi:MAG: helix-turn-helix domain-containing protein [Pseudomonadota bacterium]